MITAMVEVMVVMVLMDGDIAGGEMTSDNDDGGNNNSHGGDGNSGNDGDIDGGSPMKIMVG